MDSGISSTSFHSSLLVSSLKVIRPHQWLKNLLIFVPLMASHKFSSHAFFQAAEAFCSFCLCASTVYVINDLVDINSDRIHPRKRYRPFASGALKPSFGWMFAPALLAASFALAVSVSTLFLVVLTLYFATTCLYSFRLKQQVIVDVLLLAILYTFRVLAGAGATMIVPSFWLLAFCMFLFLCLALVKRYSEMIVVQQQNRSQVAGRGYFTSDSPVILSLGAASAYNAVLVMALYINSPDLEGMYQNRVALWLVLPPFLYWVSRIWLKAHRGEVHDDPLLFAATDKQSWVIGAAIGAAFYLASISVRLPL